MRTETITFAWGGPPLRSNDRVDRWTRAAAIKDTRTIARLIVVADTSRRDPFLVPVTVTGIWTVKDRRRRDVSAMAPTVKACVDGFVDAGLLPLGDHWQVVTEERYRIELGDRPGFRIEITDTKED